MSKYRDAITCLQQEQRVCDKLSNKFERLGRDCTSNSWNQEARAIASAILTLQHAEHEDLKPKPTDKVCAECGSGKMCELKWVYVNHGEPLDIAPPSDITFCRECNATAHRHTTTREDFERTNQ